MFKDIEILTEDNAIFTVQVSAKALAEILRIFETNGKGVIVSARRPQTKDNDLPHLGIAPQEPY